MNASRYYLITNDGPRAALEFWCHMGNLPEFLVVVDNPAAYRTIPDGARCRGLWYGTPFEIRAWEGCWRERVEEGGIEWISEEDWALLKAWAERHRKATAMKLLFGGQPEAETAQPEPAVPPPAMAVARPQRRQSRWT